MGSFAKTVMNALLGWIRTGVNQMWGLLDGGGSGGGMLAWIGENWKVLALLICLAGVAVDVCVYLLRWRPYKVWASFFRRLRGEGEEADEVLPPAEDELPVEPASAPRTLSQGRAWVYPDGTASSLAPYETPVAELVQSAPAEPVTLAGRASSREMPQQYVEQFARPAQAAPDPRMPYVAPMAQLLGLMAERGEPSRVPAPQSDPFGVTGLQGWPQSPEESAEPVMRSAPEEPVERRPRRVIQKVADAARRSLTSDDEELSLNYNAPRPAVDKQQAYHAPVYPPAWKGAPEQPVQEERPR